MLSFGELRPKARTLADVLPYCAAIRPGVVLLKDGGFLSSLRIQPRDVASCTAEQLVAARWHINNAINRFGGRWGVWIEARKDLSADYPQSVWPDPLSGAIDAERKQRFSAIRPQYETSHFISIGYLPPPEAVSRISALVLENLPKRRSKDAVYRSELESFLSAVASFRELLSAFMPRAAHLEGDDLATMLHGALSIKRHPVKMPELPVFLDGWLADCEYVGGRQPSLGNHHLRTISIRSFPSSTTPGLLDELNKLDFPYRWVARWLPYDKAEAEARLTSMRRQWFSQRKSIWTMVREAAFKEESALANPEADSKVDDANAAMDTLGKGSISFGQFSCTITVTDPDLESLAAKVREVEKVFNSNGMVASVVEWDATGAWLGSLPGMAYADVDRPLCMSLTTADMAPLTAVWAGPARDDHLDGPELLRCHSDGGTPFRLCVHPDGSDVGHGMIIGNTGGGKSTLVASMMAAFRRYPGSRVIVFDMHASARAMTLGLGGDFFSLSGEDDSISFQPLARIDQDSERQRANDWLCGIIAQQGVTLTPEIRAEVWATLRDIASRPREHRTLTVFRSSAQSLEIKAAIEPFTLHGAHPILDGAVERLEMADVACFELARLMESPQAVGPVLSEVFHVIERGMDGRPCLMIVDEAWQALEFPMLAGALKKWFKTFRKKNCAVWISTQSLTDIASSPIADVVLESCPSRIYLANDAAHSSRSAYEKAGFNSRQIDIVARMMPKRDYYFSSTQGNRMFQLGLSQLELAFAGASRPEDHKLMNKILARYGREEFVDRWLEARGMEPLNRPVPYGVAAE